MIIHHEKKILKNIKLEEIDLNKKDLAFSLVLGFVLILNVILLFVNSLLTQVIYLSDTSIFTFFLYSVLTVYAFVKALKFKSFNLKKIYMYMLILTVYLINFMIFEPSRSYLLSIEMLLIYFFFIPIGIFIVSQIQNWNLALEVLKRFAYIAIFLSTIGITIIGYSENVNYMEFSYSLLPFIVLVYFKFRETNSLFNLFVFFIAFYNILILGARAPVLFLILFIVVLEFNKIRKKGIFYLVVSLIFLLLIYMTYILMDDIFLNFLYQLEQTTNSRFLTKMLDNQLIESDARSVLYTEAASALKYLGFGMYGLFGDRLIVNEIYVHNIFYEVFLSFGYILGIIFFSIFILIVAKILFTSKNSVNKYVALIFTTALFLRYLVSGSFVVEGNFYIYAAVLINLYYNSGRLTRNEKSQYSDTSL